MKKTVTLMEVIVGAIILAIIFGGLIVTFISVRNYVNRANMRLVAANLARSRLNELNNYVREDTWNTTSNPLYPTSGTFIQDAVVNIYPFTYTIERRVDDLSAQGRDYRRVVIRVQIQ
jgi:Tfp pilus assembly protein PilE